LLVRTKGLIVQSTFILEVTGILAALDINWEGIIATPCADGDSGTHLNPCECLYFSSDFDPQASLCRHIRQSVALLQ
jgi:hypothetical protein